jgi:anti-sigma regulatory factor (Ser/Thr protein kinase)
MPQLAKTATSAMPGRLSPLDLEGWPSAGQLSAEGLPESLLPGLRPPTVRRAWLDADQGAAQAREFTRHVVQSWGLAALAEDATLIVSELVTNALRHGVDGAAEAMPAGVELMLCRRAGLMACAVIDPGADVPLLLPPDHAAETGRGLHVVEALSAAWGWARLGSHGKAVWATLRAPGTECAPARHERLLLRRRVPTTRPATRGSAIVRRCGQTQANRYQRPSSAVPYGAARSVRGNVGPAHAGPRAQFSHMLIVDHLGLVGVHGGSSST